MGKHINAKHDDETWVELFRRWHAGEAARALRAEAGVSGDTWSANAARLGMRICDLPPDHPARRAPAFADRADDYRHSNSKLNEGQWRELFTLRAQGVPDKVLSLRFGVKGPTICYQADVRGISLADVRAALAVVDGDESSESPSPLWGGVSARSDDGVGSVCPSSGPFVPHPDGFAVVPPHEGEGESGLAGVEIVMGDPVRTMASFDAAIARAGAAGAFMRVTMACKAKLSVKQAVFSAGSAGDGGGGYGPHPDGSAVVPPQGGEGEEPVPEPVLRESQKPPEGDWTTWLFLGGRGAGKTLAGATWLSDQAEALGAANVPGGGRLALIGPTLHDVREVMIEGASGILSLARWRGVERPVFEPSRRRLVFPNGALAHVFSAEDPDSLRGPQFSAAWADEFCAWRGAGETLSLLRMGLRLAGPACGRANARLAEPLCLSAEEALLRKGLRLPGPAPFPLDGGRVGDGGEGADGEERAHGAPSSDRASRASCGTSVPPPPPRPSPIEGEGAGSLPPRLMISTTPRPTQALRALRAEAGLVETHAGTRDNAAHLAAGFVEGLERLYGGTRRAAQEIEGRVVEVEGALFTAEMLAACRGKVEGAFDRVVVALDPTTTAGGNACGIVAAGRSRLRGNDDASIAFVLADRSVAGVGPLEWARRAAALAEELGAAAIVAEVNQGGDMVKTVLKAAGCAVPVKEVRATRGKRVRAEPVAALYEQGRVRHVAGLGRLEEELMAFGGDEGACDFDRADALVWAITDLLIDRTADGERGPRLRSLAWEARGGGISAPLNLGIARR